MTPTKKTKKIKLVTGEKLKCRALRREEIEAGDIRLSPKGVWTRVPKKSVLIGYNSNDFGFPFVRPVTLAAITKPHRSTRRSE